MNRKAPEYTQKLEVRVTDEQRAHIEQGARTEGVSMSEYLRQVIVHCQHPLLTHTIEGDVFVTERYGPPDYDRAEVSDEIQRVAASIGAPIPRPPDDPFLAQVTDVDVDRAVARMRNSDWYKAYEGATVLPRKTLAEIHASEDVE